MTVDTLVLRKPRKEYKNLSIFGGLGLLAMLVYLGYHSDSEFVIGQFSTGMTTLFQMLAGVILLMVPVGFYFYSVSGPDPIVEFNVTGFCYPSDNSREKECFVSWKCVSSVDYNDTHEVGEVLIEITPTVSNRVSSPYYGKLEILDAFGNEDRRYRLTFNISGALGFSPKSMKNIFQQVMNFYSNSQKDVG